jgi:conjugal transfer pilus assembly protein TraW
MGRIGKKVRVVLSGAVCLALALPVAQAHDLGVLGKVWPIAEPNILVQMAQAATHVDWTTIQRSMLAQARKHLRHMPDVGIPEAERTGTHYKNPSIVLQRDIRIPVRRGSRYVWRVLYPKGTRVNPLETGIRPVTRMLFFDPKDKGQWAFARAVKHAFPYHIILVATSGDLPSMAKRIGQPVFYSVPKLAPRLTVTGVPALVGVGNGTHEFDLAITTFSPKVVADLKHVREYIHAAWYGLPLPASLADGNPPAPSYSGGAVARGG